jgi:hypothetical protein
MPARGDRRPLSIPTPADEDADEKQLDEGAPSWGIGLRGDIRRGFAGLQRDIRAAIGALIVALVVVPIVAMALMAVLVGGQISFRGFGVGFATTPNTPAAIAPTPPTSTSTTQKP